jgi:hypothetical protein
MIRAWTLSGRHHTAHQEWCKQEPVKVRLFA